KGRIGFERVGAPGAGEGEMPGDGIRGRAELEFGGESAARLGDGGGEETGIADGHADVSVGDIEQAGVVAGDGDERVGDEISLKDQIALHDELQGWAIAKNVAGVV